MARFVVTAGHGNGDPGAVAGVHTEADLMVELRDIVAHKLRNTGHEVVTDGAPRQNWALRLALALIKGREVAVELHMNASTNPLASGVETLSLLKDKALAQRISFNIAKVLGIKLRGEGGWLDQVNSHRGRLAFVTAGGLIVEVAFISNPDELRRYLDRKWTVAGAIADALTQGR